MRLVARRDLEDPGLHFHKALLVEPGPHRPGDRIPRHQERLAIGVPRRCPPWRRLVGPGHYQWSRDGRPGASASEPVNEFRESANIIDIIRLSLHRYRKLEEAARFGEEAGHFLSKAARLVHANTDAPPCTY